jgi:hypothetical protein
VTRSLSFIPSPADIALEVGAVPRASPLVLTGPAPADHDGYMAQLWRRPTSVHAGGEPVATAYGDVSDGTASVRFSAIELSVSLLADSGYYDDLWMVVLAIQQTDLQPAALRWGWLRVEEAGNNPIGEIFTGTLIFTVSDDVCHVTYAGQLFTLPVVLVGSAGALDGMVTVSSDILYFGYEGFRYSSPAVRVDPSPPGVTDQEAVVIDDVLYLIIEGICYSATVVSAGLAPLSSLSSGTTLVLGSDEAQYKRTVYPDGAIRYKPVLRSGSMN